ncbi:TFIIS-type domain-containing protein [Aphelenchoides besseyi]|nr:TFIIS-type domain-containing protein [Aphelenchoides besseyi]
MSSSFVGIAFCPECELTQIVADVMQDPTLPKTEDHPCPRCKNRQAVFFQAQSRRVEEEMRLYYVCTDPNCGHRQIVAQNGHGFNANVYASLISNLWETFDRQGVRDRLREIEVRGEQAFLVAMPVSNMLLAIIADAEAPSALCKQKLNELALHLHEPLGVIA